ncbi:MAG TPA: SDR family NAD(P)-dependent oxidoreductase [Roseiflexaceae bacterium]|nr:SDR family NAD(P)-dependent oxidoreductase [Roseiflexaceae bacterium]
MQKANAPLEQLADTVVLVTGAGSGLGRAAAVMLAQAGARVALLGRTEKQLREVADAIESDGGTALVVIADVSKPEDMQQAIQQIDQRWERLDCVFANAGVNGVWAPIEDLTPEDWSRTLNINLTGTFLTIKYATPLLKRRGGSVIVTASVNGTRIFSNTGATAYSSSKAGQVALTKMLALELAPHKVRVNVICPGWIESEIEENTEKRNLEQVRIPVEFPKGAIPLTGGKPGKAEQVAQLVLFLASDASSHITGTEVWIDGAESLLVG